MEMTGNGNQARPGAPTRDLVGTQNRPLIIGTRASKLALTQTQQVAADLRERGLTVEVKTFTTEGDVNRASLSRLGGVGVFAADLRIALLQGECDLAVHSMKDLPTVAVPGLFVAAVPPRVNPADGLVARDWLDLDSLPAGARIGTGSPRRAAQILSLRPDVECVDIRGNVPTRLGRVRGLGNVALKAGLPAGKSPAQDLDAVVLAISGLKRLGLEQVVTQDLSEKIWPAAAQGALALEAREELATDPFYRLVYQVLRIVDDLPSRLEVSAERSLMRYLEAGCAAPLGVRAELRWQRGGEDPSGRLELSVRVVSSRGEDLVEVSGETAVLLGAGVAERDFALTAAAQLGVDLAQELLEAGGGEVANLHADITDNLGDSGTEAAASTRDETTKTATEPEEIALEKLRWGEQ